MQNFGTLEVQSKMPNQLLYLALFPLQKICRMQHQEGINVGMQTLLSEEIEALFLRIE